MMCTGDGVCRQKTDTAKSARRAHDRSPFSDGVPVQECASRRRKFVRVVQGWKMFARHAFLTWNMVCSWLIWVTAAVDNISWSYAFTVHAYLSGGWWRWALVSPDGVAPSRMVSVSASVKLPLHHKVQKFSSVTSSPGWSWKKGRKTVVVWWWCGVEPCKLYG